MPAHACRKLLCFDFAQLAAVRALSRGPSESWLERGLRHEEAGRLRPAEDAYRKALHAGEPRAEAAFNLGNVLHASGRRGEARRWFFEAVTSDPAFAEGWNNLGNVLAEADCLRAAVRAYRRALVLAPGYRDAEHNLAEALRSLGRSR